MLRAGGGGQGFLIPLASITLTADTPFIDLGSWSNFTFIKIFGLMLSDGAAMAALLQLNNDAGANYAWSSLDVSGAVISANPGAGDSIPLTALVGGMTNFEATIFCDPDPIGLKNLVQSYACEVAAVPEIHMYSGWWTGNVKITSAKIINAFGNNFAAGTKVRVAGLR